MSLENRVTRGADRTYEFQEAPYKEMAESEVKACIAIVALFQRRGNNMWFNYFHIEWVKELKLLSEKFSPEHDQFLFIKKLSDQREAEIIIKDIRAGNPEHNIGNY